MRLRTLVRLAIESVFIVLVLVVAGLAGLGTMGIIVAGLIAWILTAIAEGVIARSRQTPATFVPPVRPARPVARNAVPSAAPSFESGSAPPEAVAPEWLESAEVLGVHVAGFEPAPSAVSSPPSPALVPEEESVATEEPKAEPAEAAATERTVVFAADSRQWNVWELERLARAAQGRSPARAEEVGFLLRYLREFASPDGLLPPDFDALVRESFPELVSAAGA
jgi:hypothetical protein